MNNIFISKVAEILNNQSKTNIEYCKLDILTLNAIRFIYNILIDDYPISYEEQGLLNNKLQQYIHELTVLPFDKFCLK